MKVSLMTITVMAFERYLAICKPLMILSKSRTFIIIAAMWIIGLTSGFTRYYLHKYSRYIPEIFVFIFFVAPFVIIMVLYILIGIAIKKSSKIQKNVGSIQFTDENSTAKCVDRQARTHLWFLGIFFFLSYFFFFSKKKWKS